MAERDTGRREGLTTADRERLKQLDRQNRELKRASAVSLLRNRTAAGQQPLAWERGDDILGARRQQQGAGAYPRVVPSCCRMNAAGSEPGVDLLLPSVERARAAGVEVRVDEGIFHRERSLLEEDPEEERRCLALVVRALLVRRAAWSVRTEVSEHQAASMPRTPPAVRTDFEVQAFAVLREQITARPGRCSHCRASPGRELCGMCGGEGVVCETHGSGRQQRTVAVPCYGCLGPGSITCGPCEGTGTTHHVVVDRGVDTVHGLEHAFLPPLPGDLDSRLRDHLMAWNPLPDALRFDLSAEQGPTTGSPYRSAAPQEPRRWGHDLGDVAKEARRTIARLGGGELLHQAAESYLIPLLVLRYRRNAVAVLAPGPGGAMTGFGHVRAGRLVALRGR